MNEINKSEISNKMFSIIETNNVSIYLNKSSKKCLNEFEFCETISRGLVWKVKKALRYFKDENNALVIYPYAVKKTHKNTQKRTKYIYYDEANNLTIIDYWEKILEEIKIMKILGVHENIVQLYEIIDGKQHPYIYLVTTYCDLGQIMLVKTEEDRFYYKQNPLLLTYLGVKENIETLSKKEQYDIKLPILKFLMKQIINALKYIHSKSIVHRDLKPENILFSSEDNCVKIIDFSISTIVQTKNKMINEPGGSIFFQAPEISISQPYNPFKSDIWSLGIIMYIFLCEDFPFFADSELELQIKISDQNVNYPEYFDESIKELIDSILRKNPEERISLEEILKIL